MNTFPLNPWLDRFDKDPESTWEAFVSGNAPVSGFALAGVSETLGTVFGGLQPDDARIQKLDATLTQWLDPFLAWNEDQRHHFGYSNYVQHLDQAFTTVAYLRLPKMSGHLFQRLEYYSAILPSLTLASYLDPMAAVYRVLAQSEHYCPRLQPLWLRLCRNAGVTLEDYYLDIGLLGLRGIPLRSNVPPAWLAGLAAWLPHASNQKLFLRKLRSLRAMDPKATKFLSDWSKPLLEKMEEQIIDTDRVDWWRKELKPARSSPKKGAIAPLSSPYPRDLTEVFDQFEKTGKFEKLASDLRSLFSQHEDYAQRASDTYYLVHATAKAAGFLLKQSQTDMAKLASQLLRRALVFAPWDIPCWHLLGRSLASMGHVHAAEWVFWDTLRRDPNNLPTYNELGILLSRQGRLDEAEAVFRKVLIQDANDSFALPQLEKIAILRQNGGYAEEPLENHIKPEYSNQYDHFRAPGLAIASDFVMRLQSEMPKVVHQRARTQLEDLLKTDAQHGVVRFVGRRHGLLPHSARGADETFGMAKPWILLEDFSQEKNIQQQARQAASLKSLLPERLQFLVQAVAQEPDGWKSLVKWFEPIHNPEKQAHSRKLSDPSDQLLYGQLQAIANTTGPLDPKKIPSDQILRDMCRQAAEFLLPAGTEPVMLEAIAA